MILKRKVEAQDILRIVLLLTFAGLLALLFREYSKSFGGLDPKNLHDSARQMQEVIKTRFPRAGLPIFLALHVLHVVISFIPAGLIQFAGGVVYGFWVGMIIGIVGSAIGTTISFYLSRLLGRKVVTLLVSEKQIDKIGNLLEGNTSTIVLLALYIVPSPKDFFAYFLGLTNLKFSKVFLLSMIGRLPGMVATTYIATQVVEKNYAALIVGIAICILGFAPLVIFQKQLLRWVKHRRSKEEVLDEPEPLE